MNTEVLRKEGKKARQDRDEIDQWMDGMKALKL